MLVPREPETLRLLVFLSEMMHQAFCSRKKGTIIAPTALKFVVAKWPVSSKKLTEASGVMAQTKIVEIKANISSDYPLGAFGRHIIFFNFLFHNFNRGGAAGNSRRALCRQPGLRGLPC
jgi:hypothetical protein